MEEEDLNLVGQLLGQVLEVVFDKFPQLDAADLGLTLRNVNGEEYDVIVTVNPDEENNENLPNPQ